MIHIQNIQGSQNTKIFTDSVFMQSYLFMNQIEDNKKLQNLFSN